VQNDPVNFIDPSGLMRIVPIWGKFCVDTGDGHPECVTEITGYIDLDAGTGNWGGFGQDRSGNHGGGGNVGDPRDDLENFLNEHPKTR
jgi:hypothetical protein